MDSCERDVLAAECRTFSVYLTNQVPSPYVVSKYCEAHSAGNIFYSPERDALDAALVSLASRNRILTRMVDVYTSVFFKRALMRKKLVLLLAISESAPATHAYFDATDALGTLGFCWKIAQHGLVCGAVLMLSLVCILPLHLVLRATADLGLRVRNNGRHAPRA